MKSEISKFNKVVQGVKTIVYSLSVIYLMFFINAVSVSAKTNDTSNNDTTSDTYTLTLVERDGVKEQINGSDINLKNNSGNAITYDDALLKQSISKLSCVTNTNVIQPQSAKFEYKDNSYVLTKEVYGNKINQESLYNNILTAIKNGQTTLYLESANCYENPKYVVNSPKVSEAKTLLNNCISSKITYNIEGITQTLDNSTIKDWVSVDDDFNVTIDEQKAKSYIDALANTYTSSLGTQIQVSGGNGNNHGWIVDSEAETKALIENIKSGQTIEKKPAYTQTSVASYFSNVGDTYVEVDKTKQHLWFYKDGYLVVEGDVVTGNESNGCSTPTGVYNIYNKQSDAVLVGDDYQTPVSFWMPFFEGYGLHDATWRSEFGGEIYKTSGSHGCVNLPYDLAKTLFENISVGDTVICYTE